MKRFFAIVIAAASALAAMAQFAGNNIKNNPGYIWGEGRGNSVDEADREALAELVSQVSLFVKREGSLVVENVQAGKDVKSEVKYESVMKTYSFAQLDNVQRVVDGEEPNFRVVRYIKKAEIDRIFAARIHKLRSMVRVANNAYLRGQHGEALRYYYWSLVLLESVRHSNEVTVTDEQQHDHPAGLWLQERINSILGSITCSVARRTADNVYELAFLSNGKPVANLDFSYFDGQDYSEVTSVLDGQSQVELRMGHSASSLQVRVEYKYAFDSQSDREVAQVLEVMRDVNFPRAQLKVPLETREERKEAVAAVKQVQQSQPIATSVVQADASTSQRCDAAIQSVIAAVRNRSFASVQKLFTPYGYCVFDTLVHNGRARIVGTPRLSYSRVGDNVVCRSVPMQLGYSRGRRFMEDVAFVFDENGLIDNVMYGLGKVATADICSCEIPDCSDYAKQVLITFLENYKTAFAMKRIDYIERLFADDAIIITGRLFRKYTGKSDGIYHNNYYVKQTRQSKQKYISNLRRNFNMNEYINIKFANTDLRKFPGRGEVYAVQVKQDYFSASYGDSGYLFLLVDVNNPDQPVIHVRSWQPQPDKDWGLVDEYKF